ncbi:MAG: outer membrane protein [Acidobacteriota bacterium]|jgi:outer membrane protein|nr:outer membrane protein [Acidobacteriota bacterium]
MKRIVLVLALAVVAAVPAFAQNHRAFDLTGYASWVDTSSEGTFDLNDPNDPVGINFDPTLGYGVAANIFFGNHLSTEFAITRVENDVTFRRRAVNSSGDGVEMMPITGTLQWHFAPTATIDPYIGAGAAYVLIDDVDRPEELNNLDFESIDFDDDIGLVVNAGIGIRLGQRWGLTLDGKYVPLEASATARRTTGAQDTTFDINPIILSAGLSLRF